MVTRRALGQDSVTKAGCPARGLRTRHGHCKPGLCQEGRMGRNVSHSPQLQRGRSQNNLLFRLYFGAAKQSLNVMEWVQGHGRLQLPCREAVAPFPLNSLSASLTHLDVGHAAGFRAGHSLGVSVARCCRGSSVLLLQHASTSLSVQAGNPGLAWGDADPAHLSLNVTFRGIRDLARLRRVSGNLPSGAGAS